MSGFRVQFLSGAFQASRFETGPYLGSTGAKEWRSGLASRIPISYASGGAVLGPSVLNGHGPLAPVCPQAEGL